MKTSVWRRARNLLANETFAWALWFGLSLFAVLQSVRFGEVNNFVIYRHVYPHLKNGVPLYLPSPQEYYDVNLYGPLFGLLIAPFGWLPQNVGAVAWVLFNVSVLLFALYQLPVPRRWKILLVVLSAHELMNASSWLQINAFVCACIVLGFSYIQKGREGRAAFFLMLATFVKLLGVVGFAFYVFSNKPVRLVLWTVLWSAVFFLLPLVATRPAFLFQSYKDWFVALAAKNEKNGSFTADNVLFQNVSVIGMVRRIFYLPRMNDLTVLLPAAGLFASQYLPIKHWTDLRFRLYVLCSVLISTVIFSTGSESPTYIIAMPGICLWYLLQPKTKAVNLFFGIVFFFTTFSYSDLVTPWFRETVVRPYSLKALPAFAVWLVILVQIHRRQFLKALHPTFAPLPAAA